MKIFKYLFLLSIGLIAVNCVKKHQIFTAQFDITSPHGLFSEGLYYLKNKNYEYALRSFYTLVEDFPTDSLADDAQFYVAEILANPQNPNRNLLEAISEYQNLIKNYPESPFVLKAQKQLIKLQKIQKSNKKR
ncbi:MAG: tetratricopeptide repeat protein [candidate division WOR-3 bacterium]|nr:tetratricopeptide repeat protein [candidate division WOR-3 bacterium]MCX7757692.1 tetratricopeptide repeat protein [candidate division WOR-3 bacterium]MDW7987428.1 tetratricopeptide repeat protein [candidate division WOR-3 bacterium]